MPSLEVEFFTVTIVVPISFNLEQIELVVLSGGQLTDISGRSLYYGADAQVPNTGGVLATAPWVKHSDYVNAIPQLVKDILPEVSRS